METAVDMTPVDIGTLIALAGMLWKMTQDRAAHAEEMGRLKQQVVSLEARASGYDARFASVERKLETLIEAVARIEATLDASRSYQPRTPIPHRRDN